MSNIYDQIREENIKKYGTDINRYGPVLLSNLYNDKTHFIYELLQNAEDACERAKKKGVQREFFVSIHLFPDRLEIRHNGIEFDEKDVKGICGLVEGTKDTDSSQIGKFGIGFKSVYAYTKSPEVHSGKKFFYIKNYVQPYAIEKRNDIQNEETLFVIPFDHDKIPAEDVFSEIKERLKTLGLRTLLFLRNIKEISWEISLPSKPKLIREEDGAFWEIEKSHGKYSRESKNKNRDNIRQVHLSYSGVSEEDEKWLVFERPITTNGSDVVRVEVAYLLSKDKKTNKEQIIPAKNTELFVFFPTEKETHLKFLIQGAYHTTSARDDICYPDDWNKKLIYETSLLIKESVSKIKEMDILDISFLNTLPLQVEYFSEKTTFRPIYGAVKEKLSGSEALLPSGDGEHVSAEKALLADGEPLRNLLSSKQLNLLFGKKNAKWLDKNITDKKTPELRKYLMEELKISEIDPEKFARTFTEEFIKEQDDSWVKRFYVFLLGQNALWRKGSSGDKEGLLRSKPIIRLETNRHTPPFNTDGKPLAYLPSKFRGHFPTIKENIVNDQMAKEFLQSLGLRELDSVASVMDIILPKYLGKEIIVNKEDNIQDVEQIIKIWMSSPSDGRKEDLFKKLNDTPFLRAKNIVNSQITYRKPTEIYIGETYAKNKTLENYFEGNDRIWFLDEQYGPLGMDAFKEIGCETKVRVKFREPSSDGNVTIVDRNCQHKRGLDGFDPDCEIEGLEWALKNRNLERAIIIWDILKVHYKRICGTVETCARQNFSGSEKEENFSKMGDLLNHFEWLPDKKENFHKPSRILLSDLHDRLDKESFDARYISEKLRFEKDAEQKFLEQLPYHERIVYEKLRYLPEKRIKKIIEFIESLEKEVTIDTVTSPDEICDKYQGALISDGTSDTDESEIKTWTGISPDEEEDFRKEYGDALLKRLKNPQVRTKTKIVTHTEIVETDVINPREFLLEQYGGRCQICNTILDLGSNRDPHFKICRLFETQGKNWWTNNEFNVLCLCPNCYALMKHGGRDLRNILETAKKVLNNEISPEEINERSGDFYIVEINVAGKEREIFYTPKHMGTLAAFIEKTTEEDG